MRGLPGNHGSAAGWQLQSDDGDGGGSERDLLLHRPVRIVSVESADRRERGGRESDRAACEPTDSGEKLITKPLCTSFFRTYGGVFR